MHPRKKEARTARAYGLSLDVWDKLPDTYKAEMMADVESDARMSAWETWQQEKDMARRQATIEASK